MFLLHSTSSQKVLSTLYTECQNLTLSVLFQGTDAAHTAGRRLSGSFDCSYSDQQHAFTAEDGTVLSFRAAGRGSVSVLEVPRRALAESAQGHQFIETQRVFGAVQFSIPVAMAP